VDRGIRRWIKLVGVGALYIEPGSPCENGYAEGFHGRLRDEFLALEIFDGVPGCPGCHSFLERRIQRPSASQLVALPDPGRVRRQVCGFRLGQLGSSRTRGLC
jgi:transposase InsO family protein